MMSINGLELSLPKAKLAKEGWVGAGWGVVDSVSVGFFSRCVSVRHVASRGGQLCPNQSIFNSKSPGIL